MFKSPLLPFQYQSNVLIPVDGLAAYVNAVENWNQLLPTTQQAITDFLTPKVITQTSSLPENLQPKRVPGVARQLPSGRRVVGCDLYGVWTTQHFVIFYPLIGSFCVGRVNQVYVETIANGLEQAWSKYANTLGYRAPALTTVFIVPFGVGGGAVAPPRGVFIGNDIDLTPGRLVDGTDPTIWLRGLVAHEFFHIVQWNYFPSACALLGDPFGILLSWIIHEDVRWWMEPTAKWAQHMVTGDTDKSYYHAYLSNFMERPWQHLDTRPISPLDPLIAFPYGTVLFPIYLTERLDSSGGIIRVSWEKYSQGLVCGSMEPALQSALQTRGTTVEPTFPRFVEANYLLSYQKRADFLTAARMDEVFLRRSDSRTLDTQVTSVVGPLPSYGGQRIERLGAAYVEFNNRFANPPIGRALTITVDIFVSNATTDPVIKLWAVKQYTPTLDVTVITPQFRLVEQIGSGRHYVAKAGIPGFDSYERVGMAIINPQVSGASLNYTYSAGVVPPAVLYAGQNANGFVSTNGGAMWNTFTFPSPALVQAVAAVPNAQGQVGYMSTTDVRLWKTTDAGQTFSAIYDFKPKLQGLITNTVSSLITVDPRVSNTLYVGIRGYRDRVGFGEPEKGALFKSTDGGLSFGNDLLTHCHANRNPADWQDCAITALAIDPTNSNVLWLGQNGFNAMPQAVMRSTDGGQSWQSVKSIQSSFTALSISNANPNVVWVLSQEQLSGEFVLRTANGGATWNSAKVDNTLNPDARTILADPFNTSAAWESAGFEGLKRSTDGNLTWQPIFNRFFNALGSIAPQVLYASGRFPAGAESIQWSTDGGATWFNLGLPTMVGGGPLAVVAW